MTLLRFPQRRAVASPEVRESAPAADDLESGLPVLEVEQPPANLRFLLTPDNDPSLDYLDQLSGLDLLDDVEREARIASVRHTGS